MLMRGGRYGIRTKDMAKVTAVKQNIETFEEDVECATDEASIKELKHQLLAKLTMLRCYRTQVYATFNALSA
jgi:hypothetical protein